MGPVGVIVPCPSTATGDAIGRAAVPAARCRKVRRGKFMASSPWILLHAEGMRDKARSTRKQSVAFRAFARRRHNGCNQTGLRHVPIKQLEAQANQLLDWSEVALMRSAATSADQSPSEIS